MTVTLINPFEVPAAAEGAFIDGWRETAAVFAASPGYIDTRLHRSLDATARFRFVNVAHWASADAWAEAMKAHPPREGGVPGIEASPALYAPAPGGTVESRDASVEDDLRAAETGLAKAYMDNDVGFLDRLLADDYRVTDGPGTVSDKPKVLADHGEKRLRVTEFTFDDMAVRRLGTDVATVDGHYTWNASYLGRRIAGSFRYLRVYLRDGGRWRLKAAQVTPVLPRPAD